VLTALEINNFRCIERFAGDLDPTSTAFIGENAAGKTSLLEAIYVLSRGRALRGGQISGAIRAGSDHFRVAALISDGVSTRRVGMMVTPLGERELRLDGEGVYSLAPIAAVLPVSVIDPGIHRLLEEGPAFRRQFLDWGTFHVEPGFVRAWRRFQRALSNRNAALRAGEPVPLVQSWDHELVQAGSVIDECRSRYMELFAPAVATLACNLLDVEVRCSYSAGWIGSSYREALVASLGRDRAYRTTTAGPHRADLKVTVSGEQPKNRISRGQQKLLTCALVLGQLKCYGLSAGRRPCLLLDDPAAELDVDNLGKLLAVVREIPTQLIVTALAESTIAQLSPRKLFHVKQGAVSPVL
jgi:DNA replication and repair protein RecF